MSRNKKPEQRIKVEPGTEGQPPFWPSEGAQEAGTIEDDKETIHIPVVDSVQEPTKKDE